LWVLGALVAPAQIIVQGGSGTPTGIPEGASIWYGPAAPANTVGANGDYFLDTNTYCLYGPKADGTWPSTCVTSISRLGYVAENLGNKGAASGYAPLDANALVPQANLPNTLNGTSVPANTASDQTMVTTAAAVGSWTTIPSCPDTGGFHLNYSQVTHGFSCGDTGGTVGSVIFGSVEAGTNSGALLVSGSLGPTDAGLVNANQLSGVSVSGLTTGLVKITHGTGAPSTATFSDLVQALGFTPENPVNKGSPNGYAPLNSISQVPLSNLPVIPFSQTSGTQAALGFSPENTANKNEANGYAPLDANKLVPIANLPAIASVNGTTVPANTASDQTVVTTASAVGSWATLPSCPDTSGNHLNYSQTTHGFICGTTGGSAGSVQFGGVGSGTNANSLLIGGSLAYTGAGRINANQLSGVSLTNLATGLLKITTGTGVPSIAASSDVTTTLGFTPESVANKNAANGYAPLDMNGLLPAANLPTSAVTSGTLADFSLPAALSGLSTTGDVDSGGNVNATGNIYANMGSTAAGCLHLADTNGAHDMGVCAPSSGFNGLWSLPPAAGTAGKALFSDGAGGSLWTNDFPTLSIGTGSTAAVLSAYSDPTAIGYNTFYGANAGNQTMGPAGGSSGLASFNVGIGYSALAANTTGFQNIAIGEDALTANTTGGQNVAIGSLAMVANTTGSYNTAVGENALGNNTTGYDNFAFGLRALFQNTTGYNNAAFGIDSVGINQTGYRNAGFGVDSCAWIVTGYENSCMGMNTVWSGTTGYDNTGVGFNAMFGVTSGHYNTGLGAYADYYYPNTMTGISLALASGTHLSVGWYWYKVSYVLNGQETALSNNSYLGILTTAGNQSVSISGIPTYSGPFTASARRIYRTVACPTTLCTVITANQLPRHWYYVATIGDNTTTTYTDTTADANLGAEESSTPSQSIALGAYATVYNSNQMAVGSDPSPIYQIWLGNGVTTATAPAGVQVASSGASGTNTSGEDLILAGGPGTGSASGGNTIFKYAPSGSSGSVWNSLVESFRFTGAGVFQAASGGTLNISSAAHSTPAKVGLAGNKPTTCSVGELYFASDASAGQNILGCTASNTWTQQGGSSGGVTSIFGRTGAVVAAAGDYTAAQVTNAVSTLASYSSPSWLTAITFGGTTLNSTGGMLYNNTGTGNTQLIFKNSSSQATNGTGPLLFQNNAGTVMSFINWDGGFAEGDGTNYKISLDGATAALSSDAILAWHSQNNVFAGTIDTGLARGSAGVLTVTNGSSGYGTLNAGALQVQGTPLAAVAISGSAADLGVGTLSAARLPAPTASTLGGVEAVDCSSSGRLVQKINVDGTETCATLTSLQSGGTTLNSAGGTIYNNASTGYTQLVLQDSSSQAAGGQAQILMQNNSGANVMFLGPSSGFAIGDGSNWKSLFSGSTQLASNDFNFQFKNVNNVFSGTADLGYARESAGVLKVTNGASGYGALDASGYSVSGTAGLTVTKTVQGSSGSCTMTFTAGLLTATTCP
jgi:hypothetical protein